MIRPVEVSLQSAVKPFHRFHVGIGPYVFALVVVNDLMRGELLSRLLVDLVRLHYQHGIATDIRLQDFLDILPTDVCDNAGTHFATTDSSRTRCDVL